MISLFRWIFDNSNIIKIYRMPHKPVFRAHLLGLTFALIFVFITLGFDYGFSQIFSISGILILIFLIGTYIGGPFVILLIILLLVLNGRLETQFWISFLSLTKWYLIGYAFGALFATFYNDFLFLYLIIFKKKYIKISFVYDKNETFTIIKSPKPNEEKTPRHGWGERKLYDYKLETAPDKPYTILFVANPMFCEHLELKEELSEEDFGLELQAHHNDKNNYIKDPIMNDADLFYRFVDRALFSFELDEVLGRPEIWSRVRIITIFDKDFSMEDGPKYGLVEPMQDRYILDNRVIENLSVPLLHEDNAVDSNDKKLISDANYRNIYLKYQNKFNEFGIRYNDIDVIFTLSRIKEFDRCGAASSTGIFNPGGGLGGEKYELDPGFESDGPLQHINEYYAKFSGKIALNVIGTRQKLFIHEFAHAMSSYENGSIVDEYFDERHIQNTITTAPYAINRRDRKLTNTGLNPVPQVFRKYNNINYISDMDHPSAEEHWRGFFPERFTQHIGCTMDSTIGSYQFDKLLSRFMYDRLFTKFNRKP